MARIHPIKTHLRTVLINTDHLGTIKTHEAGPRIYLGPEIGALDRI
jgi:hypothetical protein